MIKKDIFMKLVIQCNTCKKNLYCKNKDRLFCSKACASLKRKIEKIVVKCLQCKKEFKVLPSRKNAKYCSKVCASIGKLKNKVYVAKGMANIIDKICERCNKSFELNLARRNKGRFCSKMCLKKPNDSAICIQCDKNFEYNYRSRSTKAKFCSRICSSKHHESNGFWKKASGSEIISYLKKLFETKGIKKENGCLEWIGGKYKGGYGGMTYKDKPAKVHRIAYMLYNNDWNLSSKVLICHKCDNVACYEKTHLFKGTAKDNMEDMINKNRQNWPKGEMASNAKMSKETALKVKELLKQKIKMTEIAKLLNIGKGAVNAIKRSKSWKHI